MSDKLPNVGPKSAAWLRQVGIRTQAELAETGAVAAFVKIRRAGFKPSLNLLYSLEGALLGCHWQHVPPDLRDRLKAEAEAATALLPGPRGRPAAAPVTTTHHVADDARMDATPLADPSSPEED
jgi:hypothetical protein